ncbi:MAG: hypothetical protein HYW77_03010 [Parcubacteria group bacterium]|nr:hypothetical protein [Parcubacteria group bacterium]
MIKQLYKKIIRKFDLSEQQLGELKGRLVPENICKGPFVQGEKNCPNTTALAIKEGVGKFTVSGGVKKLMKKYGVKSTELWLFYAVFDIPAIFFEKYFRKSLTKMRDALDGLVIERQRKV